MPTESGDSRDVNEGDDTEETGGLSIKQNAHMENAAAMGSRAVINSLRGENINIVSKYTM